MALTELLAFEAAYQVLLPLDDSARKRALQWLSDALAQAGPLAAAAAEAPVQATAAPAPRAEAPRAEAPRAQSKPAKAKPAPAESKVDAPVVAEPVAPVVDSTPVAEAVVTAPARAGRRPKVTANGSAVKRPRKRKEAAAAVVAERNGRAYRRMPNVDEVMGAYQQIGTISGLADHFEVPQHTAQSWARRLRSQGYQIGRN